MNHPKSPDDLLVLLFVISVFAVGVAMNAWAARLGINFGY
jgi:hypothetical protein